jgi:hypothetical protein
VNDDAARTYVGYAQPDFVFGCPENTSIIKRWDLSFFFRGPVVTNLLKWKYWQLKNSQSLIGANVLKVSL